MSKTDLPDNHPDQERHNYADCKKPTPPPSSTQSHTHEFPGSTKLAEECDERHNHRFAGVTSEAILVQGGHVHEILVNTDFFDHHHEVGVRTGLPIDVGGGKHVHFAQGNTTFDDDHCHKFEFATLIEAPLLPQKDCP